MDLHEQTRACTRCKGEGTIFHKGFTATAYTSDYDGVFHPEKVYPDETKECYACRGAKVFPGPNVKAIVDALTTTRGVKTPGKRRFRKALPEEGKNRDIIGSRVYYVWRLARFHGGKDVCLPMGAEMDTMGDPWKEELDLLARQVARLQYGDSRRGLARWQHALTGEVTPGFQDGPTYDEHKPVWEMLETK